MRELYEKTPAPENEFENSKLFVYPSLAEKGETFGLAVLEAMSCGSVPVVPSLECFQDLVVPQENGYVFDHRATDVVLTLSSVLMESIQSAEENIKFSSRCLERAKEFELDCLTKKYIADFDELLSIKDS